MKLTMHQLGALFKVYERWQNKTPHAIMPMEFEIVTIEEYRKGDYIGVWVGGPVPQSRDHGGALYLGIESDGHTHS